MPDRGRRLTTPDRRVTSFEAETPPHVNRVVHLACDAGVSHGTRLCHPDRVEPFLTTERMILRRFDRDDVDAVLALDSDPRVRVFVEDGEPVDRDEVTATIEHWLGYYERSEIFGFWAAVEKHTDVFLGWFHFRPRVGSPVDEPELGYRLVASAWGKARATPLRGPGR